MKKAIAILLTALLFVALLPGSVFADIKIEKPEEMEYPSFNPLENSGEGFPTNSDPTAGDAESPEMLAQALADAAASIGKTPLTGVYSFVDASAGYNEQEGGASLWDGVVRTKWAGNEMPFINIAQLDGKYAFDGKRLAQAVIAYDDAMVVFVYSECGMEYKGEFLFSLGKAVKVVEEGSDSWGGIIETWDLQVRWKE